MARDYAARNRAPKKKKNGGIPGWIWLVAGLSIGLAVAAFTYISRPPEKPLRGSAAVLGAEAEEEAKPARKTASDKKESVAIPPKEKPRFTFYELLPSQEVVIPGEEVAKATATPPAAKPPGTKPADAAPPSATESGVFIIQVASYRSQAEADKQKASLALVGIESKVEKVTIDNRDTYYRVRIGPERDGARARSLMSQLESHGIQGLLVKVK